MSDDGIHDADTSPTRWLYVGEPTSLQEQVELHAMAGMLVAREACVFPEVVDAVCAAPAWKSFTSHIMLGGKDSLGDDQIALAQYVAKTLVERHRRGVPGKRLQPRAHRADGVLPRRPAGSLQDPGGTELMSFSMERTR
jgi:hypothetical protein